MRLMSSVLMNSPHAGLLLGDQVPRLSSLPPFDDDGSGKRALRLAERAGLDLDPWQQLVLDAGLRRRGAQWAAFEVCLILARQNGKGTCLEALELAALFLFPDVRLILHSAHEFKTAAEAFLRIRGVIEDRPEFERKVSRIRTAAGAEAVELKDGKRLRFVARSSGSGRGFTSDLVILDEAYKLGDQEMAALLPTLSARPDPQVWYTSTAGGQDSIQLGRVRARGVAGGDPSLAFMEWSVDPDAYDPANPREWARANPGMGIRISADYIERERAALGLDTFARERLSVGDYPAEGLQVRVAQWAACADRGSQIVGPVALAFAVERDGVSASVAVAGRRADGRGHGELVDPPRRGTGWLIPRVLELAAEHDPCVLVINPVAAAGAFEKELAEHGWVAKPGPGERQLLAVGAREYAQACGALAADVANDRWRHLGQGPLDAAVAGAQTRDLADAWAWSWKHSRTDISPLEAVTLARHGFMTFGVNPVPEPDVF
jgi:hypothetical protein